MNWREFTQRAAAMAEGHAEPNAVAISRALNKRDLAHVFHCWQRFSHACSSTADYAPLARPAAPSPWLPPLP